MTRFMDNLQTEVLEMEFQEFSRGMATISESEFAKILMRYTKISSEDHKEYIDRVTENIKQDTVSRNRIVYCIETTPERLQYPIGLDLSPVQMEWDPTKKIETKERWFWLKEQSHKNP